jgi:hypothetical protein
MASASIPLKINAEKAQYETSRDQFLRACSRSFGKFYLE